MKYKNLKIRKAYEYYFNDLQREHPLLFRRYDSVRKELLGH